MATLGRITKKRLTGDQRLLQNDPLEFVDYYVDKDDLLNWWFLIKGPKNSVYEGGYYIGQINHNKEYPMKPPDFKMFTPSGRFEIGKKICLTNSSYHAQDKYGWSTMWTVHAILNGFLSIMMDEQERGIAHIKEPMEERKRLAKASHEYNKKNYSEIYPLFKRFIDPDMNIIVEKPSESKDEKEENASPDKPSSGAGRSHKK